VNYGFDVSEFKEVRLMQKKCRSKEKSLKAPRKASTEKLPISAVKKADFMSLVASGTIPKEYKSYFESLPCSKSIK
jgi:hypothetical protein